MKLGRLERRKARGVVRVDGNKKTAQHIAERPVQGVASTPLPKSGDWKG